ncbi:hypothetical protein Hanom_Chr11g01042111 [Helianthus anomalus]
MHMQKTIKVCNLTKKILLLQLLVFDALFPLILLRQVLCTHQHALLYIHKQHVSHMIYQTCDGKRNCFGSFKIPHTPFTNTGLIRVAEYHTIVFKCVKKFI